MAAAAVKSLVRSFGVFLILAADRVACIGKSPDRMRLLFDSRVAREAHVDRFFEQEDHGIGRMGTVTFEAEAFSDRLMNVLFAEFGLIVAGIAEVRDTHGEQFGLIR